MTTGPIRCQCGSPYFTRSYGGGAQCVGCGKRYTESEFARLVEEPLIELCRHCNGSSSKVSGWWGKFVECLRCGARGPRMRTPGQAIVAWNNQHAPLALRGIDQIREPYDGALEIASTSAWRAASSR